MFKRAVIFGLTAAALSTGAAARAQEIVQMDYLCERDAVVKAVYINGDKTPVVVLSAEGRQAVLTLAPSGSGARYTEQPDGGDLPGWIWWEHQGEARLEWGNAADGNTPIYTECQAEED